MASRAARRFSVYAVLSPGVSHFRSFSLVYAVNFAVSIFCLWLLNGGLFGLQMASWCLLMYFTRSYWLFFVRSVLPFLALYCIVGIATCGTYGIRIISSRLHE